MFGQFLLSFQLPQIFVILIFVLGIRYLNHVLIEKTHEFRFFHRFLDLLQILSRQTVQLHIRFSLPILHLKLLEYDKNKDKFRKRSSYPDSFILFQCYYLTSCFHHEVGANCVSKDVIYEFSCINFCHFCISHLQTFINHLEIKFLNECLFDLNSQHVVR